MAAFSSFTFDGHNAGEHADDLNAARGIDAVKVERLLDHTRFKNRMSLES